MTHRAGHIPVLAEEVLALLSVREGGHYLDATFGGGGHTRLIFGAGANVRVTALDRDPAARERAKALRAEPGVGDRMEFHALSFADLAQAGGGPYDGILFDLGVSSFQLDDGERGFSFRYEAPLDMRMNPGEGESAAEYLARADREDLRRAFSWYGEELHWRRIAEAILALAPEDRPKTTRALADLVEQVVPRRGPPARIHPATKIFQGLRIAVNGELEQIEAALPAAFAALAPGGVLAVISFHSLEDRMVKRFARRMCGKPEHRGDSRAQQEREVQAEDLTRKPIKATEEERQNNPRSRSAVLRAIRRLAI